MAGILVGYALRKKDLKGIGSVITMLIWILLFLLGNEVGGNKKITEALGTLGIEAAIITRYSGQEFVVISIFHGFVVDFSVPFLVTFFCSI